MTQKKAIEYYENALKIARILEIETMKVHYLAAWVILTVLLAMQEGRLSTMKKLLRSL